MNRVWLCLMVALCLLLFGPVAPARGGVVLDLQDTQVGDPDAGSAPPVVPPAGSDAGPGATGPSEVNSPASGTSGANSTANPQGKKPGDEAPGPGGSEISDPELPPAMSDANPYTLVAIGILLLLLAAAGGYYFYRNRDREESADEKM